jgi:hypothetical protein
MKTQLFAPKIDNIIDNIKWETAPINPDIYKKLKNVYIVFSKLSVNSYAILLLSIRIILSSALP